MGSLTKGPVFTYHQDGGEGEDFVRALDGFKGEPRGISRH